MARCLGFTPAVHDRVPGKLGEHMSNPPADRDDGQRPRITREIVLRTALRIVDESGVDKLTMRRLGQALDRDPMSLYRYAPNKAAVLDGVAEIILDQVHLDMGAGDWVDQLRSVAHRFRDLALAHPNAVPLLVTRPLATPLGLRPLGTLRPLEAVLDMLVHAGFSEADALHIYRFFFGFLQGHVLNELQEVVDNPEETDDLLRLGLHRLPIREFPRLRSLAHVLATYDGRTELDRGLDIVLTGLLTQLRPEETRP